MKNKSSVTEQSIADTQYTHNILKNQHKDHPNKSYSPPSWYHDPLSIDGLYPRNRTAKQENKKGQEVKIRGEIDVVDSVYQMFKKLKDRNDKIEEMKNYFDHNSKILFPFHSPLDISNYG